MPVLPNRQLVVGAVLFALPWGLPGDTPGAPDAPPDPPSRPAPTLLRPVHGLVIGGAYRGRMEIPDGAAFLPAGMDAYYQSRFRLNLSYSPVSWLSATAETQDAREFGYNAPKPPAGMQDPFDLRQAYIQIGNPEGSAPMFRIGRQDLAYGAGRLIASGEWSATTKTFDVARFSLHTGAGTFDLVGGSVVQADPDGFDRHKPGEHFYASYNSLTRLIANASIEPYFIVKTVKGAKCEFGPAGDATVFTPGLRATGRLPRRIDYTLEAAGQSGSWGGDSIAAWAATATAGWTVNGSARKPRVSVDYSYASGDRNPRDGARGAFDPLYGLAQPFFSETGQFSWKNTSALRAGVDFNLTGRVKIQLDYRDYWLATLQDGLYNSSGTRTVLTPSASSRHVGQSAEMLIVYSMPLKTTLGFGLGKLYAGDYLRESGKGGGYVTPVVYWSRKF